MTNYAEHFSTRATPQREQADARQVKNSAGGYVFKLEPSAQLERFLILGADSPTYYAGKRELVIDNARTVLACLNNDGKGTVRKIAEISKSGRAPKNAPAVFALAIAAGHHDLETRRAALHALPEVCRYSTDLFDFVKSVEKFRGWGYGLRKAVARWYTGRSPESLAYQVAKYQQRNGWSHRDLLRLAKPGSHGNKADVRSFEEGERPNYVSASQNAIFRYVVAGINGGGERVVLGNDKRKRAPRTYAPVGELPAILHALEELKTADRARTIELIRKNRMTHEMVNSKYLKSPEVWEALLEHMPLGALVRSVARMTAIGLIAPLSDVNARIAARLTDRAALVKARIHPIAMLSALMVYQNGRGVKSKLTWSPVPQIIDALDAGFYEAFGSIRSSGARSLLAIDVSGSMDAGEIAGVPGLTPRMAAAAMAMVTARTEPNWHCVGFAEASPGKIGGKWGGGMPRMVDIPITPRMRIDEVVESMKRIPMGGTDCALPFLYATKASLGVDSFIVYTDSETWAGDVHPHQALREYREKSGRGKARSIVVGFAATDFTIADPSDPYSLDVVGFDTAAPQLIADFSRPDGASVERDREDDDASEDSEE